MTERSVMSNVLRKGEEVELEKGRKEAAINFAVKLLKKRIFPSEIEELTGLTASEIPNIELRL